MRWTAVAGALVVLIWSVPGLIINPDFATGDAATAERVLGSDMNGWHAVSGFLVAIPVLLAAWRARPPVLAALLVLSAGSLVATGLWALADTTPAWGLFSFPNNEADALLHFATAAIWLAGAASYYASHSLSGTRAARTEKSPS